MTWAGCFPQLAVLREFRGCCAGRRNPNKARGSLWDEKTELGTREDQAARICKTVWEERDWAFMKRVLQRSVKISS